MSVSYVYKCSPERQSEYLHAIIESETFAANAVVKSFKKNRGEEVEGRVFAMDKYQSFMARAEKELEVCNNELKGKKDPEWETALKAYKKDLEKYLSYSYDDYIDAIIAKEKAYIKMLKDVETVDQLVQAAGGRILFQSYTEQKVGNEVVAKSTFFVAHDHKIYVNLPKLNGLISINTDGQVPGKGWITTLDELNAVREQYGSEHNEDTDLIFKLLFEEDRDVIIKFL